MSTAADLFTATVLDFNDNGKADVLLPNYEGVLLGQDWQTRHNFSAAELAERTITFGGYGADRLRIHQVKHGRGFLWRRI